MGNLWQLARIGGQPSTAISTLSSLYGDIFRLRVGVKDFGEENFQNKSFYVSFIKTCIFEYNFLSVVMSSVDTIVDIISRDEALARESDVGIFHDRSMGQNTGRLLSYPLDSKLRHLSF